MVPHYTKKKRIFFSGGADFADKPHIQDLVSGDEIISDSYEIKIVDDTVYEVDCKKITKGAENIGSSFALVATFTPPSWNLG